MNRRPWVGLVVLVGLTVLPYLAFLNHPFHYDDFHSIVENPHVRTWANLPGFFTDAGMFSSDPRSAMYRPLVLVSYALNHALSGYRAWSYHALNLLVHLAAVGLVFVLGRRVSGDGGTGLVAAAFFALHPANGEVVNYISSRSESLGAVFLLAGLLAYDCGIAADRDRIWWRLAGLTAFAASLLAKSVGIVLLPLLVFWEIGRGYEGGRALLLRIGRRQWPFWLVGLAYLLFTRRLLTQALVEQPVRSLDVQLLTQVKALVYYGILLVMPVDLSVDHQFVLALAWWQPVVLLSALLLASLAWLGWRGRHRLPLGLVWLAWPVVVLLPTIVVPLNVLVNEHRLYLPTVALAVSLGLFWRARGDGWGRAGLLMGGVWLLLFAILAGQRTQVWRSESSLWADALEKGPLMPRPRIELADRLKEEGRHEAAMAEYQRALTAYPEALSPLDRVVAYNNLGATCLAAGRFVEAVKAYQQALSLDPEYAPARQSLDGLLALRQTERNPAAERLRKEGLHRLIAGDLEGARLRLEESLQVQNDPQTWMALALVHERRGDRQAALQAYQAVAVVGRGEAYAQTAEEKVRALATPR
ncbi:MAG: tetratricopeptide repeat protein [Candidatus Latescibacterota bacterium]|jgi:Tfp pilus assembly protein PilF